METKNKNCSIICPCSDDNNIIMSITEENKHKQNLGQFMTTNFKYILQKIYIPENITTIIEPFCGNGDLLNFIDKDKYIIECYDIEPKKDFIIQRDTIKDPPIYTDKYL